MARYIDADKLFRYVDEQTHISKGKLQNYIRENHTTDVAEVVRCKDCKYSEMSDNGKIYCFQPAPIKQIVITEENRFCSYGQRRDT